MTKKDNKEIKRESLVDEFNNHNNVLVNREELKEILESSVNNTFDNRLEIINYKLDAIGLQTTRTNGRVNDLEDKVDELEKDGIKRLLTCPQKESFVSIEKDINELKENSIKTGTIKGMVLKSITIAGIFFTILFGFIFGVLKVLVDAGIFLD